MCANKSKRSVNRSFNAPARWFRLFPQSLMLLLVVADGLHAQHQSQLCTMIANKKLQVSSGMQMYCFGPQLNGAVLSSSLLKSASATSAKSSGKTFSTTNVDAANPSEDKSPNGTQAFGQSETSIAAAGPYVVEAWNDATGFFSPPCSPNNREQLTGLGFSSDGGKTFTDLGGLPNFNCAFSTFFGDPSVEAYQSGGNTYFYISSLFSDFNGSHIAFDACTVVPPGSSGASAVLSCGGPFIAASGGFFGSLDKDFLSIDPVRGLLYVSYTNFNFSTFTSDIDLSVCDIGNGALGGNPAAPVCSGGFGAPAYLTVDSTSLSGCELEGAYPAVDLATGDVYVAYEYNWGTNFSNPSCESSSTPVQVRVARVPQSCMALPNASPCVSPSSYVYNHVNITSMDAAMIPGYNRFPANDFPRIAVSDTAGTVSVVWNDAGRNPLGDILLQSYRLGSLLPVQGAPVKLNSDSGIGTLHFLPAVRNADANGNLNVTWYDRRLNPNSAHTDVFAALGVNPATTSTPKSNTRVTSVSSDWSSVSSDIVPNFGDYTDNYVVSTGPVSSIIFAAWSDGRFSDPQPFCAHQATK